MTQGHKQWKKFTLTGDALSAAWWPCPPFTWNNSISLGLNLFILIWIIPPGLNLTNAIPPFIYSVGPGNQFMLSGPNVFFVLFFVVDSFRLPCHLFFSYSPSFPMSLVFQIPPSSPCCLCFRYPPSLCHVACVLFMYPNHLILRWVVNECVQIRTKRRRNHPSNTPTRQGRKIEVIQPMPTNG